jgi:hypothetical protein
MSDPFGRAIRDHYRDEQDAPLVQRDGEYAREHPIERFYFSAFDPETDDDQWLVSQLDGPLLDLGAGAGRHALYFQDRFETVAVEVSDHLVETMRDRGVADARRGDMFSLREQFERDQFQSALAIGTQVGLAGSMQGLRRFLGDLAHVTTPDATAVFDGYDPESERLHGEGLREDTTEENGEDPEGSGENTEESEQGPEESGENTEESEQGPEESGENPEESDQEAGMLGFRADPTPGLAYRLMWFDYEGTTGDGILFRLFSPDRVREAAVGTGWSVTDVRYTDEENPIHYRVALEKT